MSQTLLPSGNYLLMTYITFFTESWLVFPSPQNSALSSPQQGDVLQYVGPGLNLVLNSHTYTPNNNFKLNLETNYNISSYSLQKLNAFVFKDVSWTQESLREWEGCSSKNLITTVYKTGVDQLGPEEAKFLFVSGDNIVKESKEIFNQRDISKDYVKEGLEIIENNLTYFLEFLMRHYLKNSGVNVYGKPVDDMDILKVIKYIKTKSKYISNQFWSIRVAITQNISENLTAEYAQMKKERKIKSILIEISNSFNDYQYPIMGNKLLLVFGLARHNQTRQLHGLPSADIPTIIKEFEQHVEAETLTTEERVELLEYITSKLLDSSFADIEEFTHLNPWSVALRKALGAVHQLVEESFGPEGKAKILNRGDLDELFLNRYLRNFDHHPEIIPYIQEMDQFKECLKGYYQKSLLVTDSNYFSDKSSLVGDFFLLLNLLGSPRTRGDDGVVDVDLGIIEPVLDRLILV